MPKYLRPVGLLLALGLFLSRLAAQSTVPVLSQAIPAQSLTLGTAATTIDLRPYFGLPGVTGQMVQFNTVLGTFNIELFATSAPLNVANFLNYVTNSYYNNTMIHRSVPGFVIQGGGYTSTIPPTSVPLFPAVALEANLPNTLGTIAMARSTDLNSATSQWFINTVDNSTTLDPANTGGYTVIGRVLGTGMVVVNAIALVPTYNAGSPFDQLPLLNYNPTVQVVPGNFVTVNTVAVIAEYPTTASASAVLHFSATSSAPLVATASLSGSSLVVTPGSQTGTATITVTTTDTNGNIATGTVAVTVNTIPQTITFSGLSDVSYGPAPISLSAIASSGLPVVFAVVSGPATVNGNQLTLTGSGSVTVGATQPGNGTYAAAPEVDRTFTVLANFASWQQSQFTAADLANPAVSGPTAVYGSDGLPNLVKYALGLNPKVNATGSALPATSATATDWVYTYTRPTAITDVTCTVEVSTDLSTWTPVTSTLQSSAGGTDTWTATYPSAGAGKVFFRLAVSQ